MKEKILFSLNEGVETVKQLTSSESVLFIEKSAKMIAKCFLRGNKILTAGNGGSLCDAAHMAEELTGFFRSKRKALPAIALSDPGHLTCVGNDIGFEYIFSRAVEALGKKGDIFIGLTTSGNSENLIKAFKKAQESGLKTIAFLGKEGGKLKGVADLELIVGKTSASDRAQEAHMLAIHVIIEMIEVILFQQQKEEILEEMLIAAAR